MSEPSTTDPAVEAAAEAMAVYRGHPAWRHWHEANAAVAAARPVIEAEVKAALLADLHRTGAGAALVGLWGERAFEQHEAEVRERIAAEHAKLIAENDERWREVLRRQERNSRAAQDDAYVCGRNDERERIAAEIEASADALDRVRALAERHRNADEDHVGYVRSDAVLRAIDGGAS